MALTSLASHSKKQAATEINSGLSILFMSKTNQGSLTTATQKLLENCQQHPGASSEEKGT